MKSGVRVRPAEERGIGADDKRSDELLGAFDSYSTEGTALVHELALGHLQVAAEIETTGDTDDKKGSWWRSYLAGRQPVPRNPIGGRLRVVDLFCGPGGLANGVSQLAKEVGISFTAELIVDQDEAATLVYAANHSTRQRSSVSVRNLIEYGISHTTRGATFEYKPEFVSPELAGRLDGVDLILAGPPCQGHSNLNNWTRRTDPRNELYLTVPAFAVAARARMCIIENVPTVLNDAEGVVESAIELFGSEGYQVTSGQLSASSMGWPQSRKRHFVVARRDGLPFPLAEVQALLRDEPRSLWWAIGDLEDASGDDVAGEATEVSDRNQERIDWLFDNDEYDLALAERPECHQSGTSYTAVYGRLRKDRPAPTITTGFMSPGRGRFTHPTRRRVLTAREAARLQGFPDTYGFDSDPSQPPGRAQLAKWIGDAVPMPLGYAAALSAFASGIQSSR